MEGKTNDTFYICSSYSHSVFDFEYSADAGDVYKRKM